MSQDGTSQETKRGLRPWLKVLLGVSLALNLAVVGLGAGAAWRFRDGPPMAEGPPMLGRFVFKDLGRKEIRRLLREGSAATGGAPDRRRAEMGQVIALIKAETLDVPAMNAVLDAHIVETSAFMRSVVQAWGQRLEGMSLKDRRRLADRMQRRMEHDPHHSRRSHDDFHEGRRGDPSD